MLLKVMDAAGIDVAHRDEFVAFAVDYDHDDNGYLKKSELEDAASAWNARDGGEEEGESGDETEASEASTEEVEAEASTSSDDAEAAEKTCEICSTANAADASVCSACGFTWS
jgi:hypothetical protein